MCERIMMPGGSQNVTDPPCNSSTCLLRYFFLKLFFPPNPSCICRSLPTNIIKLVLLLSSVNNPLLLLQVVFLLLAGQLDGSPKPEITKLHSSKVPITFSLSFHQWLCILYFCFLVFLSIWINLCLYFIGGLVYHFVGLVVCLPVCLYWPLFDSYGSLFSGRELALCYVHFVLKFGNLLWKCKERPLFFFNCSWEIFLAALLG